MFYPEETGGFLGGREACVGAVYPSGNKSKVMRRTVYLSTKQDRAKAEEAFKGYGMDFLGSYHTHPKHGVYPSPGDIATDKAWGKYHFIIGMRDETHPVISAYEYRAGERPIPLQIKVV